MKDETERNAGSYEVDYVLVNNYDNQFDADIKELVDNVLVAKKDGNMLKKTTLAATIAIAITACSPQDKVVNVTPQTTVTESMPTIKEPLSFEVKEEKTNVPKIVNQVQTTQVVAIPVPVKPILKKISTVEQNLIDHMIGQKVTKANAKRWASLIVGYCKTYGVDPYTILAMIQVESEYDPNEVGSSRDTGLMQILPATQRYMKINGDLFNPSINIEIGTKYLGYNQKHFGHDLGIVAYNQGEGNVSRGTYNTKYLTQVKKVLNTIDR